jgi:hypothetical protein
MTLTKHQVRKIAKLQSQIDYFCGQPCFEIPPVITTHDIEYTDTILVSVTNATGSRWYETQISFWAYISPRGKLEQCKADCMRSKSIYDKHFRV